MTIEREHNNRLRNGQFMELPLSEIALPDESCVLVKDTPIRFYGWSDVGKNRFRGLGRIVSTNETTACVRAVYFTTQAPTLNQHLKRDS